MCSNKILCDYELYLYCKQNENSQYTCDCPTNMYWNGSICLIRKKYQEPCKSTYMCIRLPLYDNNVTSLTCQHNDSSQLEISHSNETGIVNGVCL